MRTELFARDNIRYFHKKYLVQLLDTLSSEGGNESLKVLDIGCGRGEFTIEIKNNLPKPQVMGCDIDEKWISIFKKNTDSKGIEVVQANARRLPYVDNTFDVVTMIDVLEHISNPDQILRQINRVLKPGGTFHLVVPCEGDLSTIDGWIKRMFGVNLKKRSIGHVNQFKRKDIERMLRKHDFDPQRKRYSYYFIYQFVSFLYYLWITLFHKGKYVALTGSDKNSRINAIRPLVRLGGYLINTENQIFSKLPGQTLHITTRLHKRK